MSTPKQLIFLTVFGSGERHGWINPSTVIRLFEAARSSRPFQLAFVLDKSPLDYARNLAVEQFLLSKAAWLVMIDNDTVPPENFLSILDEAEENGYRYIGFPVPIYRGQGRIIWNVLGEEQGRLSPEWAEHTVGGGVMMIHRVVFEEIPRPWFEHTIDPATRAYTMSEDMGFAKKAEKAGFKVRFHGGRRCGHLHTVDLLYMKDKEEQP